MLTLDRIERVGAHQRRVRTVVERAGELHPVQPGTVLIVKRRARLAFKPATQGPPLRRRNFAVAQAVQIGPELVEHYAKRQDPIAEERMRAQHASAMEVIRTVKADVSDIDTNLGEQDPGNRHPRVFAFGPVDPAGLAREQHRAQRHCVDASRRCKRSHCRIRILAIEEDHRHSHLSQTRTRPRSKVTPWGDVSSGNPRDLIVPRSPGPPPAVRSLSQSPRSPLASRNGGGRPPSAAPGHGPPLRTVFSMMVRADLIPRTASG